jgi:hypothetical protein
MRDKLNQKNENNAHFCSEKEDIPSAEYYSVQLHQTDETDTGRRLNPNSILIMESNCQLS